VEGEPIMMMRVWGKVRSWARMNDRSSRAWARMNISSCAALISGDRGTYEGMALERA
jgi:hypothetical protein